MQVQTEIRPRDGGADIFLKTHAADPSWLMLRWDEARQRMTGFCGGPAKGGISRVRPVTFASAALNAETVGSCALFCMLHATGLGLKIPGAKVASGLADRVSSWESFLNAAEGRKGGKPAEIVDEENIEATKETVTWLAGQAWIKVSGGAYNAARNQGLQIGSPVSGFEALKIQASVARVFPEVAPPSKLDLDAAKTALSAVDRPSSHAVHWYASAEGEKLRDRLQAAASAPILAEMIAENPLIARVVDAREPLQPMLIERTGLEKAGLKRLSKLTEGPPAGRLFEDREAVGEDALGVNRRRRYSVSGVASLDVVLRHLADLPPDRVPQDDRSWRIFHDVLAGCAIPIENALGVPVARTLSACKGDWVAFHAALAKSADFAPEEFDLRTMALCTIDGLEAVEDLTRSTILPAALAAIASTGDEIPPIEREFFQSAFDAAGRIVVGDAKNVASSLLETARRYASRIPALMEATGFHIEHVVDTTGMRWERYGAEGYPLLTGPYTASNGMVVRPLPNFAALRLESSRLSHCVGNYYLSKARTMGCHLYSVQSADGAQSFSTLELSGIKGEDMPSAIAGLRAIQHRALRNANPPADALDAVNEFMRHLKSGAIQVNFQEILDWKNHLSANGEVAERQTPSVSWKSVLGMDWEDGDRREGSWREWRFILGGAYGKSESPDVIWRDKGARDLVGAMAPRAAAILIERARGGAPARAVEETAPEP
jgi:hypothetical protein